MAAILDIDEAVGVLRRGGLVAFPTETVYGLGADATNPTAVARIFAAKGRPADHPLIVHLAAAADLSRWAAEVPAIARRLAEAFWPGPLTLVLRRRPLVPDVVTGGLDTVALRVPAHPLAQALLARFGGGLAAPSANRFGRLSPTTAADVEEELGDCIDGILDGGVCTVGIESTIVDLSGAAPALLRPGSITQDDLQHVLGVDVPSRSGGSVRCPGQMESHYAPRAPVVLAGAADVAELVEREAARGLRIVVLAAATIGGLPNGVVARPLARDLAQAGRELYAQLRAADHQHPDLIVVVPPPNVGVGLAIGDRLRRAAGSPGTARPAAASEELTA